MLTLKTLRRGEKRSLYRTIDTVPLGSDVVTMANEQPTKDKRKAGRILAACGIGAAAMIIVGMIAFNAFWTPRDPPAGPEYNQAGVSAGDGLAYDRLRRQGYSPQEAAKKAPGFRKACEDYPSAEQCAYGRP